jgi:hypothetical protein
MVLRRNWISSDKEPRSGHKEKPSRGYALGLYVWGTTVLDIPDIRTKDRKAPLRVWAMDARKMFLAIGISLAINVGDGCSRWTSLGV